jgi:hypothetical protein
MQELMRHASTRVTLDTYTQAITENRFFHIFQTELTRSSLHSEASAESPSNLNKFLFSQSVSSVCHRLLCRHLLSLLCGIGKTLRTARGDNYH